VSRGIVAAIIAGGAVLVTAVAVAIVALVVAFGAPPAADDRAACESRFGTECTSIPLEELEEAFEVDLPEGTVVLSSEYTEFQDWRLAATFDLPDASWSLPDGWEDGEPGVFRSSELEDDRLTLIAFTT
jgi:hypothetical protein